MSNEGQVCAYFKGETVELSQIAIFPFPIPTGRRDPQSLFYSAPPRNNCCLSLDSIRTLRSTVQCSQHLGDRPSGTHEGYTQAGFKTAKKPPPSRVQTFADKATGSRLIQKTDFLTTGWGMSKSKLKIAGARCALPQREVKPEGIRKLRTIPNCTFHSKSGGSKGDLHLWNPHP
jgi:hypothetical protein